MHISNEIQAAGDMIEVPHAVGTEPLPIITSHSIDGTFAYCERKFEFSHVYQQIPEGGDAGLAAEVGTALHEAVQAWAKVWLDPRRPECTESQWEEAVDAGFLALIEWWPFVQESMETERRTTASVQRSLGQSSILFMNIIEARFWNDYELIELADGSLAIEIPWRIIHESFGTIRDTAGRERMLMTQGKIDFVLRHRETKHIRVFDLKTTNKQKDMYDASFRFSGQGLSYAVVLGAAIDYPWREEGLDVTYILASFLTMEVETRSYYIRPNEVEDYLRGKHDRLTRMAQNLKRQFWPRRTHGCDNFMRACPYMDVCHRSDSDFIHKWFAFTPEFSERTRIYEPLWIFAD